MSCNNSITLDTIMILKILKEKYKEIKNELKFTDRLVSNFFDVREKCQSYQKLKQ